MKEERENKRRYKDRLEMFLKYRLHVRSWVLALAAHHYPEQTHTKETNTPLFTTHRRMAYIHSLILNKIPTKQQ